MPNKPEPLKLQGADIQDALVRRGDGLFTVRLLVFVQEWLCSASR